MIANESNRPQILSLFIPNDVELNGERNAIGLCKLIATCALEAIHHFEKGELSHFDAHIGNYGCEANAFRLLHATRSKDLLEECGKLQAIFQVILDAIQGRKSDKQQAKIPFKAFVRANMGSITFSPEMGYLLQARLLTITKQMLHDKDGYETERTEHFLLKRLAEEIDDQFRACMVAYLQEQLSRSIIHFYDTPYHRLSLVSGEEKQLMHRMFDAANLFPYMGREGNKTKNE